MTRTTMLVVAVPVLLGALVAAGTQVGAFPASFFVLRLLAPAGVIAALAGFLVSTLALALAWLAHERSGAVVRALAEERHAGNEAHRRFIHRLNHELKNPLTAVRAGLANLDREGNPGRSEGSLANVRQQVERLARLAENLRKLADLEATELAWETADLTEILIEAAELASQIPGRGNRQVRVQTQKVPWPLSPIHGDRDLLLLAVYNLLDNALKFSGPEDTVELRASEDGTRVTVEVADTGPGIAQGDLPHVTEELYRGQGAQGIEGSGLGLALVQRIATLHGGDLVIRTRQGQGTVVTLRLPLKGKQ